MDGGGWDGVVGERVKGPLQQSLYYYFLRSIYIYGERERDYNAGAESGGRRVSLDLKRVELMCRDKSSWETRFVGQ